MRGKGTSPLKVSLATEAGVQRLGNAEMDIEKEQR